MFNQKMCGKLFRSKQCVEMVRYIFCVDIRQNVNRTRLG